MNDYNVFGTDSYDDIQKLWEDMSWKYSDSFEDYKKKLRKERYIMKSDIVSLLKQIIK